MTTIDLSLWDVTRTQVELLYFVRGYLNATDHRMGPLYRQIGDALGITPQAVSYQVRKLERMGYIQFDPTERYRHIRRVHLPGEPPLPSPL